MVFGFRKKKKKVKASVRAVGKATTRKATPKEMEKHRATIARDKPKEERRKKKDRRETIDIGGPKKPSITEAIKKQLTKTKIVPGVSVDIPISTKLTVASIGLGGILGAAFKGGAGVGAGIRAIKAGRATEIIGQGVRLNLKQAVGITQAFATNAKTIRLTSSFVDKAIQGTSKTSLIKKIAITTMVSLTAAAATASIGGKVFGKFLGMEEASQATNIAARDALLRGDLEGYDLAAAARDELLADPTFWEKVKEWIPFKNVLDGLEKYREAAVVAGAVYDRMREDAEIQQTTGESDDEKWSRIREEEAEADKAAVDYYNEQRKLQVQWEREAEKAGRNADAAFWRKEKEKQAKMEAEDRKAIADFWIAYRKEALKIANDNRPSNLNFGLL